MNNTHDIDRLQSVIAHTYEHGLAGTICSVGTFPNIDTSVHLEERVDFVAWARSVGATNVTRGQYGYLAYGRLSDGTPVTVKTRKSPIPVPEPIVAFTLDEFAAGAGVE
ncbi:hypothetical protein BJF85_16635 [Saccharomonospora sp. CUA-673]|uniref:hypothetical protein n=1 Tax=Saccharomonospora sp. CUA-673 TaxID=1904969 RepID=UPI000968273E|nr:hypothetical protein [Saccharomonospora sp. CUA-673]OLT46471.1 hypothetical protein BJF85_16635 [Saccharomonospora sp. CUA-673]